MHRIIINQIISTDDGCVVVLENQDQERKYIFVENFEGVALTFHFTGYSDLAHIRTIYQILSTFLESSLYEINNVEITEYKDNIGYAKIKLLKHSKPIYFNCSIADGLIISKINNTDLLISDNAWNELELFENLIEDDYNQEF